ncbi:lamin tail domain-containing protein [Catenuloplanes indicus]|uniref:Endonuclease YncB(Thermonuclease family) n=1 Tax=Catenuloplanes indicus TaxID=137267 RepID=A0AAE3W8N6_9ACTN|nr:lamin tail domain-containing protein [Catenuloplanes indicus]MDQ0371292.1 endonuclease YncB(thermonuclease family) [Catenuloplanes indicus]
MRRLLALATALLVALPAAPAQAAATGRCRPDGSGPVCRIWAGRVDHVSDGDTVAVDVFGDGTGTPLPIRLIGVQAMEQHVYSSVTAKRRGECHALAATARLEELIRWSGGLVRLTAQHPDSQSRGRALRSMSVRIGGVWRDAGQILIREGHAMWMLSSGGETAWNAPYRQAAQLAARAGRNLYDRDRCGAGPYPTAALDVWVNPDADGSDSANINGEWIRIGNNSGSAIPLGGWWVRDSGLRRYTFRPGTSVPSGGAIFVHTGHGVSTATHKYWGLSEPIFENPSWDATAIGDGAYLFDPQGDLRAQDLYPCVAGCRTLAGTVALSARPTDPELIRVTNTGAAPVNLFGHTVATGPHVYPITSAAVLDPGASFDLYAATGTSDGLARHWNKTEKIMSNRGGTAELRTRSQARDVCVAWGTGRC